MWQSPSVPQEAGGDNWVWPRWQIGINCHLSFDYFPLHCHTTALFRKCHLDISWPHTILVSCLAMAPCRLIVWWLDLTASFMCGDCIYFDTLYWTGLISIQVLASIWEDEHKLSITFLQCHAPYYVPRIEVFFGITSQHISFEDFLLTFFELTLTGFSVTILSSCRWFFQFRAAVYVCQLQLNKVFWSSDILFHSGVNCHIVK